MPNIFYLLQVAVVFVSMLMVLVAAHEYGHYLFAKIFKMGVEEFSIGMFGKRPLVVWRRKTYELPLTPNDDPDRNGDLSTMSFEGGGGIRPETEIVDTPTGKVLRETTVFTIRPWPVGGFVRIKGMMPEEGGGETRIPAGFYSKPAWQRLIVLAAGPAFSILAGVAVLVPIFMFDGLPKPSKDAILGSLDPSKPGYVANLRPGDRIVAIDDKPVKTWFDMVSAVRDKAGQKVKFDYEREGKRATTTVVPEATKEPVEVLDEQENVVDKRIVGRIGAMVSMSRVKLGFGEASITALKMPVMAAMNIVSAVTKPTTIKDNLGGPGTIIKVTAETVKNGWIETVQLAALLSISVGIFNLLPIFPLDGGQMAVAIAEMIRGGRRLSLRTQSAIGTVGMGLVALLIVGVLFVDVSRFTTKDPQSNIVREKTR